jgi:hypothetical protein
MCLRFERDIDFDIVVVEFIRGEKGVDPVLGVKERSERLWLGVSHRQSPVKGNLRHGTPRRPRLPVILRALDDIKKRH